MRYKKKKKIKQKLKSINNNGIDLKKLPECKTYKSSFNKFIKNNDLKLCLEDAIVRTNKITSLTYDFLKLYIIYNHENNIELPNITKDFIRDCHRVICKKTLRGRVSKKNNDYLLTFYNEHFLPLISNFKQPDKSNLTQILKYESEKMVICYENAIKTNYFNFLFRYINCIFMEKNNELINSITDKILKDNYIKNLKLELKAVKNDILSNTLNSEIKYHSWINNCYNRIIPNFNDIQNESYYYDIQCNTMKYLKYLLNMNDELEIIGKKMFHAIPLRKNLVPRYIKFDTVSIIDLSHIKDKNHYNNNIEKYQDFLWNEYFKMDKNTKDKQKYCFNYCIETDGVGLSLNFKRIDLTGKTRYNSSKKKIKNKDEEFEYLENYTQYELNKLNEEYNVVYCDPGKCRLLYMMDNNKVFNIYSNKQRLYETQRIKYQEILKKCIDEEGIKEKEKILSSCNSKSCKLAVFKKYLETRYKVENEVKDFYLDKKLRKFTNRVKINTQRSETKMIKNINKKYTIKEEGKIKKPLIVIGNWCISYQMRNMM